MKKFLIGAIIIVGLAVAAFASGAADYIYQRSVFPVADSEYDLGTSTKAWKSVTTDQLCLSGDSCKLAWPTSGMSNPMIEHGDLIYGGTTTGTATRLPGNTDLTIKFLSSFGNGASSTGIGWQTVPAAGAYTYWLRSVSSSLPAYKLLSSTQTSTEAIASTTFSTISASTSLMSWLTASGTPGLTLIPAGFWRFHIDISRNAPLTGKKDLRVYFQVFKHDGGSETVLFESQQSELITGTDSSNPQEIDLEYYNSAQVLAATDRIGVRIYAVPSGSGTNPSGAIYYLGATESRLELPSDVVSVNTFVPYIGATANLNLGSYSYLGTDLGSLASPFSNAYIRTTTIIGLASSTIYKAADGSAAAPAYSFSSDANNGMYLAGSDLLSLTAGGTSGLYINSSGYAGILTSTPGYALTVAGDTSITGAYRINGVDYSQYFISSAGSSGQVWQSDGSGAGGWVNTSTLGFAKNYEWKANIASATTTDTGLRFGDCVDSEMVITKVMAAIASSTSSTADGITFNISVANNFNSSTPDSVFTTAQNIVSETPSSFTSFANATVKANNCFWFAPTSASSTQIQNFFLKVYGYYQ